MRGGALSKQCLEDEDETVAAAQEAAKLHRWSIPEWPLCATPPLRAAFRWSEEEEKITTPLGRSEFNFP